MAGKEILPLPSKLKQKILPMPPKFGGFKLDFTVQSLVPALNFAPPVYSSSLSEFQATSQKLELHFGAYTSDLARGKYSLSWGSLADMESWLRKEQESKFIELRLKDTLRSTGCGLWTTKLIYVCARQGTGGSKKYTRKFPEQGRKVPTKRSGCTSRLTIKSYPNTARVLGRYEETHSHATGQVNARFTRLSMETRIKIAEMLRIGITHKRIVSFLLS